ncbi:hypothetical protein OICFNHDK_3867 [Methylobacterium bullatum]|uniref:Uncharacterized protein n=1 Tax=Methylobacterium bullatum TaxID=570505 RepID=A0AAV4ZCY9_9HYPH|nr:hypothetical protein OICFNHDK_3867 [Methylobacterium bullatum]
MATRLEAFDAAEIRKRDAREHARIHTRRMLAEWKGNRYTLLIEVISYAVGVMSVYYGRGGSDTVLSIMATIYRKRGIYVRAQ